MAKRKTPVVNSDDEDSRSQSTNNTASSTSEPVVKKKKLSALEVFNNCSDVENTNNEDVLGK